MREGCDELNAPTQNRNKFMTAPTQQIKSNQTNKQTKSNKTDKPLFLLFINVYIYFNFTSILTIPVIDGSDSPPSYAVAIGFTYHVLQFNAPLFTSKPKGPTRRGQDHVGGGDLRSWQTGWRGEKSLEKVDPREEILC